MSDRAKALIKLADSDYLDCPSIPDLFHFQQTLARKAGCSIGRAWQRAKQELYEITKSGAYYSKRKPFEDQFLWQDLCKRRYRKAIEQVHQSVHAFDHNNKWAKSSEINRVLKQSITQAEQALLTSKAFKKLPKASTAKKTKEVEWDAIKKNNIDGLKAADIEKLYQQIPAISKGIQHWQQWTMQRLRVFVNTHFDLGAFPQMTRVELQACLLFKVIPLVYWKTMRSRLPAKKVNQQLKIWYNQMIEQAQQKVNQCKWINHLTAEQYELCINWASDICRSFQRASSQVEGRNGYLAFIHKANRGISNQRLKVLTTVHNYDIRGMDDRTPAERLFKRDFPDLFEFILQDVTDFAEPRRRKRKPLNVKSVRA